MYFILFVYKINILVYTVLVYWYMYYMVYAYEKLLVDEK